MTFSDDGCGFKRAPMSRAKGYTSILPSVLCFHAPGDAIERMMYGWSFVHCLPVAMADQPAEAIGTAIRPQTVQRLARDAGFGDCEVLVIDNPLFRFYRLGP